MSRSFLPLLALLLLALSLLASPTEALCKCKNDNVPVGACSVGVHACGCLKFPIKTRYKCDASASGVSAHHEWTKKGEDCVKTAMVKLFQSSSMFESGRCNCQQGSLQLGTCNLSYTACYYFGSEGALDAGQVLFKAAMLAPSGERSEVYGVADAEQAVQQAGQRLLASFPYLYQQCGMASSSSSKLQMQAMEKMPTQLAPLQLSLAQAADSEDAALSGLTAESALLQRLSADAERVLQGLQDLQELMQTQE